MPTLVVQRDVLFTHMGRTYSDVAFDELCFEFGIELDEVTSEREEATKSSTAKLSSQQLEALSSAVIYKIDVPANRYDLLCVEGLSRALRIFLGDMTSPEYRVIANDTASLMVMTVRKAHTDTIRPFVVCAILRNLQLDQQRYDSLIDLQDQLHRNLCRQRTLVAIGTHDLDTLQPPFVYDARQPTDIHFVPLSPADRGMLNAVQLMEIYETDPACKHLKPYVPIIKDAELYPVIMDSAETVLSLPPMINGSHSKITLDTRNIFIECTATDLTKANIVLDTVVTMFSQYCALPYTAESVQVLYQDVNGNTVDSYITPLLSKRLERTSVTFCNSLIGIELPPDAMRDLCTKVQLGPATLLENDTILEVTVPPTRSDILHAVDIAEDVGIAYGYNNIVKRVPQTATVGSEFALNQFGDLLRNEIAHAGYIEVLTHGLCSWHDNFTALLRPNGPAVTLSNPANVEYQVVRTALLPGLLKTLQHNKSMSFATGFKLFEISDVVLLDANHVVSETIVGTRNARRLCAVYAGPTSGFEIIHGLVDRIMTLTEIAPESSYIANSANLQEEKFRVSRDGWYYTIIPLDANHADAASYFPGRAAGITLTNPGAVNKPVIIGTFGILHPHVLANFGIPYPASCVELDLESLMS